jgi:hypothetical protein
VKVLVCGLVLLVALGASSLNCTDAALGISASVIRSCSVVAGAETVTLEKSCAVKVAYRIGAVSDVRVVRERPDCTISIDAAKNGAVCGARIERRTGELVVNF